MDPLGDAVTDLHAREGTLHPQCWNAFLQQLGTLTFTAEQLATAWAWFQAGYQSTHRIDYAELASYRSRIDLLTPRQRQVFIALIRGKHRRAIATELGITDTTYDAHRNAVLNKLGLRTTADLATIAERFHFALLYSV